jgi:hypothetical protein
MALRQGNVLLPGQILSSGDWMQSASGFYFLILQSDGNLITGRGPGPSDPNGVLWATDKYGPQSNFYLKVQTDGNFIVARGTGPGDDHGAWWATNKYGPPDDFFAIIQDDGNLVVYRGTPTNVRGVWWATNQYDPIARFQPAQLNYDLANAQILSDTPMELDTETQTNETDVTQSTTISGSTSVTETSGWSDSLAEHVGVNTQFHVGIPVLVGGNIGLSVDVTHTYTSSGSQSTQHTWSWSQTIAVPAHKKVTATVNVGIGDIQVPYTVDGTVVFTSGAKIVGTGRGTYRGTNKKFSACTKVITSAILFALDIGHQMLPNRWRSRRGSQN